eukprot:CAMPEP_0171133598 /NCGR_PEP_ID=MMETSP0766_2-20121228/126549_1 /TAXON_ID=439317 /ORGANISM="Gambierdiscus australes, Strain CAWD 149" /LENGTH=39 /DNA_ID= /DNA_START= /DNA_END= /DNA_ORIENTATION=
MEAIGLSSMAVFPMLWCREQHLPVSEGAFEASLDLAAGT